MNLFRNPIVTWVLAVGAVVFVIYQVSSARRSRGGGAAPAPTPPAAATATTPTPAPPAQRPIQTMAEAPAPVHASMDRQYVVSHFTNWVAETGRDPFLLRQASHQLRSSAVSPLSKWKLKAIWRQNDSRVAAINDGIYREGDVIEGYKIVNIQEDVVWFQTADSTEHLGFEHGTNSPMTRSGH